MPGQNISASYAAPRGGVPGSICRGNPDSAAFFPPAVVSGTVVVFFVQGFFILFEIECQFQTTKTGIFFLFPFRPEVSGYGLKASPEKISSGANGPCQTKGSPARDMGRAAAALYPPGRVKAGTHQVSGGTGAPGRTRTTGSSGRQEAAMFSSPTPSPWPQAFPTDSLRTQSCLLYTSPSPRDCS